MITATVGKVRIVGEPVEDQRKKKPTTVVIGKMGPVKSIPHRSHSQSHSSTKKIIWVTFNPEGSICSTSDKLPESEVDQFDNIWHKMVSE